tara:strand:- start:12762 stop:13004 length:243 start_codon:yes stop_codon:yes gene_type:complete
MYDLIVEAIIVGVMTIIFGNVSGILISPLFKVDLPKVCSTWNKFYTMEITLFLTGVLIHLFCEFSGINKWYCKNGFACMK